MITRIQEFLSRQLTSLRVRSGLLAIVIAGLALALSPQTASAQGKTIVILAPHPDDEALCCSGIISAAKARGDTVKVVIVTNGDDYTSPASQALGYVRESETVSELDLLGLNESDLIFLGYGDQNLMNLYQSPNPASVFTSLAGQTQTYADRGLGHVDYHTLLNGVPGPYNRQTILGDYKAFIQNLQPDEIYTVSLVDKHPDHSATYSFLAEALIDLQKQGLAKMPRVHETIIHEPYMYYNSSDDWPMPVFTPSQPFSVPTHLASSTQYL
jgi:LmbE family N-acetylglucosaminyl deacetylase